jgi:hypothetical protein
MDVILALLSPSNKVGWLDAHTDFAIENDVSTELRE